MERFILHHNTEIWTCIHGKDTPLILCNGGPGCDDYLESVSKLLEDRCQVVRFEPRGCGRSDYDGKYDLATSINDVERIRQEYGFRRCIIAGHSAGANLAIAYALKHPDNVLGLLNISGGSIVNDRDWSRIYHENLEQVGESYGGKVFVADEMVNAMGNQSWKTYIKRPGLLGEIAAIKVPSYFIYGSRDIRPSWPTEQLAALIPKGQFILVEGAEHCIWLTHEKELGGLLGRCVDVINANLRY